MRSASGIRIASTFTTLDPRKFSRATRKAIEELLWVVPNAKTLRVSASGPPMAKPMPNEMETFR
jgi:hypothetical protein